MMKSRFFSNAHWLGIPGRAFAWANRKDYPAPMFRKSFFLERLPEKALVCISAGGYFELRLNGEKVGDSVLNQTPSIFDKHIFYSTFDISSLLKLGENAFGVILGNSTYNCATGGPWMLDEIIWRDYPKFLLQLNGDDCPLLSSNPDWKCFTDGPIRMDAVKNGEFYDANYDITGWDMPEFNDKDWQNAGVTHGPGGDLVPEKHPPCRELGSRQLHSIGKQIYDCGQNLSGYVRIRVRGGKGASVKIRYAEHLDENGNFTTVGIDHFVTTGEFQTDRYTLKGSGVECWNPHFVYHGFRYVEITVEGNAEVIQAEAVLVATDHLKTGSFLCADDRVNALHRNAVISYQTNFMGFPTDCPSREKQGWTGDALLGCDMGLYNFNTASSYADWFITLRDTQRPSGQIAAKAPISCGGYNWGYGPGWDSALFMIPEYVYEHTGSLDLIRDTYHAMQKYIDFCMDMMPDLIANFGLGDWYGCKKFPAADAAFINSGFIYADLRLMAKFAGRIGNVADIPYYSQLAENIKECILQTFLRDNGSFGNRTQTDLGAALYFDLAPDPVQTAALLHLKVHEERFQTRFGIMGAKFVPRMLAEYGYIDDVFEILTQPEYPGWNWQLKQGATTLWEHWNGSQSQNHIMFGDFDAVLYKYFAGLHYDAGELTVSPCFPKKLKSVHAESRGVRVDWERNENNIDLQITIPAHRKVYFDSGNGKELLAQGVTRKSI